METRPYERDAIERLHAAYAAGKKSPCLVMPTGSGKTHTALAYCTEYEPTATLLWIVPRKSLILQTINQAHRTLKNWMRLEVKTVQSLGRESPAADLCIVDEAHFFYGTEEWSKIAQRYPRRLALTATPSRADGTALRELADCIVEGPQRRHLVTQGYLPRMRTIGPEKRRSSEAWDPVSAYLKFTSGERAIVFCENVKHAKELATRFCVAGVNAGSATQENSFDMELHRARKLDVLTSVYMVSVGYDDPSVTCAIIARPCGNATTYIQMCGRARGAGAQQVTILDLYGAHREWGLADEDRTFSLSGRPMRVAKQNASVPCEGCGELYRPSLLATTCHACRAVRPAYVCPKAKRRADMIEAHNVDTMPAKRAYLAKMVAIFRAMGKSPMIALSSYRKRYGTQPPLEWRVQMGLA